MESEEGNVEETVPKYLPFDVLMSSPFLGL